jgi:hypothetical protein
MAAFLFKLETPEGERPDSPELSTVVYSWRTGDTIPLRP